MCFSLKLIGCLTLFVLAGAFSAPAQTTAGDHTPTGVEQLETLRPVFEGLFEATVAHLPANYRKEYRQLYTDLRDSRLKEAENGCFLLDKDVSGYLEAILREIKRANPGLLKREVRLLITRDPVPNATTFPDGLILFNAGLLAACANESQVAFILCHELAHHELEHGPRAIAKRFDLLYSKEAKREMASIARQKNASEKARAYLSELTYEHRRHSRENESEADSLAAVFLARTRYDASQASGALRMLDTIDNDFHTPRFDLKTTFDFPDYPFKIKWLEEENTLFRDGARVFDGALNKDSLKTHPDCRHRATLMSDRYLKGYQQDGRLSDPQGLELFASIRQTARYEALLGAFDGGNIDLCLFLTLARLREQSGNVRLHALVGRCFNALYAAQRDHVFSRYVQAPRVGFEPGYKGWLQFLNTLRLRELAAVGYHYLNTCDQAFLQDEEFQYQLLAAAKNMELPDETARHKTAYLRNFPKGKYRAVIQSF